MFNRTKKPKISAESRVIKTAKAEIKFKMGRGTRTVQVEQIADCEPTLWLSSSDGSYGTSTMLHFKDLNELVDFTITLNQLVDAVRAKQVEMQEVK